MKLFINSKYFIALLIGLTILGCYYKKPLVISPTSELQNVQTSLKEADSSILEIIAPYSKSMDADMSEVLGYTAMAMTKNRPQSLLGNFVCDLLLKRTYSVPADFCLMNHGGLRAPLPKGQVQKRNMFELMPFDNKLVLVRMSAFDFKQLIRTSIENGGEPMGSTINLTIEMNGTTEFRMNYDSEQKKDSFWVLTSDYLVNGGDRYSNFKGQHQVETGLLIRNVLIEEFAKHYSKDNKADAKLDRRLIIE